MSVCISSPQCFICCSWWCVDTEDNKEQTLAYRSSRIKVCCDAATDFLIEPFSFTIPYVHPDIAGKRVGENNTQLFSWHWPGENGSIVPLVTSIVDMTILSIVNAAIASLPDHSWEIQVLWGCQEEPNGDGGLHARDVTQILNKNPAAGLVKSVMRLSNPTLCCIVLGGQQADGTAGAQTAMGGGHSNLHPNDILPPPAVDIIDDIGERFGWWCCDASPESKKPSYDKIRLPKVHK